tara:strand:+ start:271 stop:780 length:510 start_codon:yes stop_codon:yes gene_type:complete
MPPLTKEELREQLLALAAPEDDVFDVMERGLPLLKASNTSGFAFVFPSAAKKKKTWQAKPTIRGKQRGLGTRDDKKDAARLVLQWALGLVEDPPSPEKERAHRGAGKRPRDKRHGLCYDPRSLASFSDRTPFARRWAWKIQAKAEACCGRACVRACTDWAASGATAASG